MKGKHFFLMGDTVALTSSLYSVRSLYGRSSEKSVFPNMGSKTLLKARE